MTGIPYDKLASDIKSKDAKIKAIAKRIRQMAKPGVLGAVYRLGAGGWGYDKNGDRIKTRLWGYAEGMGIDMTQEEAAQVVKIFRESYPEICSNGYNDSMKGIWVILEEAVMDVLKGERTVRKVGPDGCIVIDKLTFGSDDNVRTMLRIQLPSGRYLHYLDAAIETVKMPWKRKNNETGEMEDVYRPAFTYYGKDQTTDIWTMIVSHGGKIFENIVQAIARDVLADKLLAFEYKLGMEVVGHVHDEGITLTDDDPFAPGVLEMEREMDTPVEWAPSLPLGSDGFEDYFYHK
jgi:DNA polymerase